MSKSKLGMISFDINKKFKSKEEAYRYGKRLKEFIRYSCNKYNWAAQALICISNIKGSSSYLYFEHNGKIGRPKKKRENFEIKINVDWHIHVLLVSKPSYAFWNKIKEYLDKNWFGGKRKDCINCNNKKVYKKSCNINIVEYYINQSEEILFCNYNCKDLIPKGYSLKDLYYANLKMHSSNKYYRKYINRKDEIDNNYYKIKDFYWNITKEKNEKDKKAFMKCVQLRKIAENYEKLEIGNLKRDNNVQNVSYQRIFDETPF